MGSEMCIRDSIKVLNLIENLKGINFQHFSSCSEHRNRLKTQLKRNFMYNLLRSGCPCDLLACAYVSYIRSLILYSFPTFCNAPEYLLKRFVKFERRRPILCVTRISPRQDILAAAEAMCRRLFVSIEGNNCHPLRVMFSERNKSLRNPLTLKPPFARTKRFSNSFIKFARTSF